MTSALVVVMLVASADADDAATRAARIATEESLGPQSVIVVREVTTAPADADVVALEGALHADAAVEIDWLDAARDHARLRVHDGSTATWSERDIAFGAVDPPVQRGRAIALVLASMMPAPKPEPPLPPIAPTASPVAAPRPADVPPIEPPRVETRHRARGAIDLVGVAAPSSVDTSVGGVVGLRWFLAPHFAWHLAAGARFGSIAAANATLGTATAGTGLAWTAWSSSVFALDLRADVWALRHTLSQPGGTSSDPRWVFAASLFVEPEIRLGGGGASLVLGAGVEQSFASVDLVVDDRRLASLPRTRLLAELGIRARF